MTENEARQKASELNASYHLLLHSTDQLDTADEQVMAEIKRKFLECEQEFDELRREHPQLFVNLEQKYRQACAGKLKTKSQWPKRVELAIEDLGIVPASSNLLHFAYEEDLDVYGNPKQLPHFPPQ